jgi:hypothetical protein
MFTRAEEKPTGGRGWACVRIRSGGAPSKLLPLSPTAPPEVVIGSTGGDQLRIRVVRRMDPSAEDYWDGNWLDTRIRVAVGRFHADINASLRADELAAFDARLKRLHQSLTGEALLESMEEWIRLSVAIDRTGHLYVRGEVADSAGARNRLAFCIDDLDQAICRRSSTPSGL